MMLTGADILKEVKNGNIEISDFDEKRLNPNSYNLRLDNKIKYYKDHYPPNFTIFGGEVCYNSHIIDPRYPQEMEELEFNEHGFILQPNKLYLASTVEETYTDKYIPCINGRSSIGRLGLSVHVTAGFGDIGFRGKWTLELFCIEPIIIFPNMEICQIYFFDASEDRSMLYNGKYQNQNGVESSKIDIEIPDSIK